MSAQEIHRLAIKPQQQRPKLVNPGKSAFTGEALLVNLGIEQALTSTLDLLAIASVLGHVRDDAVIEAHPTGRLGIKGAVSIEKRTRKLQPGPFHTLESGCQLRFEFEGILMIASDDGGGGNHKAMTLGDGQDIAGLRPLAVLIRHLLTAFFGQTMAAIQVEVRQVKLVLNRHDTLLPDPLETAIATPFAEVIPHRTPANFLFWGVSAAGAMGSCAHWQPVCKRYSP